MKFRRVLITGTTSGLGQAFQDYYRSAGAEVLIVNRRHLRNGITEHVIDITREEEVRALLQKLQSQNAVPDLFVLNAGVNRPDNQARLDVSVFEDVWRTNYQGVLNFVSAARSLGISGVTFACLSSTSNIVPNPGHLSYYLSKRALLDTFRLLSQTDTSNHYKTIVLSPVATNIMGNYGKPSGLQGKIYDLLVVSAAQTARAAARFFESSRPVLYYTKSACLFYYAVKLLLVFFPGLYRGNVKVPELNPATKNTPLPLPDHTA